MFVGGVLGQLGQDGATDLGGGLKPTLGSVCRQAFEDDAPVSGGALAGHGTSEAEGRLVDLELTEIKRLFSGPEGEPEEAKPPPQPPGRGKV